MLVILASAAGSRDADLVVMGPTGLVDAERCAELSANDVSGADQPRVERELSRAGGPADSATWWQRQKITKVNGHRFNLYLSPLSLCMCARRPAVAPGKNAAENKSVPHGKKS